MVGKSSTTNILIFFALIFLSYSKLVCTRLAYVLKNGEKTGYTSTPINIKLLYPMPKRTKLSKDTFSHFFNGNCFLRSTYFQSFTRHSKNHAGRLILS